MLHFTGFDVERAIYLLEQKMSSDQKKPTLYHCIRTASLLFYAEYTYETQAAGILHDLLEDTDTEEYEISHEFGDKTLRIVQENSKNTSLLKEHLLVDMIRRCCQGGIESISVKLANLYDNFCFYIRTENQIEIERCQLLANLIIQYRDPSWADKIFELAYLVMSYKKGDTVAVVAVNVEERDG